MKKPAILLIFCSLSFCVFAETIYVDANGTGDYSTIQAAIDVALSGDTVIVSPGTYYENLNYKGKAISLQSVSGPNLTTVSGSSGTVVFMGGEGAEIIGFTITGGNASSGAGIKVSGSNSVIRGNIFEGNIQGAGGYGAAIGGNSASPVIEHNIFRGNTSDNQWLSGVVTFINSSSPLISNNLFENNSSNAIVLTLPSGNMPRVINNTIVNNRIGIRVDARVNQNKQVFRNNVLVGNQNGLKIENGYHSYYPTWQYNLVFGNSTDYAGIPDQTGISGNIKSDPCFVGPDANDFHLLSDSPCINTGDPNYTPEPNETDLDGLPRVIGGRVDIGCYEFNHQPVAIAGPNQTVYVCDDDELAEVNLDGLGSHDDDGDELDYYWSWIIDGNVFEANGLTPTIQLPVGEYEIELIVDDGLDLSEPNYCTITVVEPLQANLFCSPRLLNTQSRRGTITAIICMPSNVTPEDINANEPLIFSPGEVESTRQFVFQWHNRHFTWIIASFDKADCMDNLSLGMNSIKVTGKLNSGRCYYGDSSIYVFKPRPFRWPWKLQKHFRN